MSCFVQITVIKPSGDLSNPGIEPRSPALQVDSLLSEPPGKPENPGVGSPFLLQGNFLTRPVVGNNIAFRFSLITLRCTLYIIF